MTQSRTAIIASQAAAQAVAQPFATSEVASQPVVASQPIAPVVASQPVAPTAVTPTPVTVLTEVKQVGDDCCFMWLVVWAKQQYAC